MGVTTSIYPLSDYNPGNNPVLITMGLGNFDIAPDNKGGRKKKEEKEDEEQDERKTPDYDIDINPYNQNHGKEYWEEALDKFCEDDEPTWEELEDISIYSQLLTRSVLDELYLHGVYDGTEKFGYEPWDEYKKESTFFEGVIEDSDSSSSSGLSSSSGSSGGLAGLVNQKKD